MGIGQCGLRTVLAILSLLFIIFVAPPLRMTDPVLPSRAPSSTVGHEQLPEANLTRICPFHTSRPDWVTRPYPCPPFLAYLAGRQVVSNDCDGPVQWRSCSYPSPEHPTTVTLPDDEECIIVRCGKRFKLLPRVVPRVNRIKQIADRSSSRPHGQCRAPTVVSYMLDSVSWTHFQRTMRQTWQAIQKMQSRQMLQAYAFCQASIVGVSSWENQGAAYRHKSETPIFAHFWNASYVVSVSIAANEWQEQAQVVDLPPYPHRPSYVDHNFVISRRYQDPNSFPALSAHCRGDTFYDELSLAHINQTLSSYPGVPIAAFGYSEAGHHEEQAFLPHIDRVLARALEEWYLTGLLKKSILLLWSDHGHMYSPWYKTPEGKLEHRNPFFIILVSSALLECHPDWMQNLMQNQLQRVTPFDIYATLQHVASGSSCTELAPLLHGKSLLCPLPTSRTCANMGIPPQFCSNPVMLKPQSFPHFTDAIKSVVDDFNANLSRHNVSEKCEVIQLNAILQAFDYGLGLFSVMFATVALQSQRPALWNVYLQNPEDLNRSTFSLLKRQTLYSPDEKACAEIQERRLIRMEYCLCRALKYTGESLEALKQQVRRYSTEHEVEVKDDLGHRDPALKQMMIDYWCQFKPWKVKLKDRKRCHRFGAHPARKG